MSGWRFPSFLRPLISISPGSIFPSTSFTNTVELTSRYSNTALSPVLTLETLIILLRSEYPSLLAVTSILATSELIAVTVNLGPRVLSLVYV